MVEFILAGRKFSMSLNVCVCVFSFLIIITYSQIYWHEIIDAPSVKFTGL